MNNDIVKKIGIEKFDKKLILNKPADISNFDGILFDTVLRFSVVDRSECDGTESLIRSCIYGAYNRAVSSK